VGDDPFVAADGLLGPGTDRFTVPDAAPGWYRVCLEMTYAGVTPPEPFRPCGQLRILPPAEAAALPATPPAEPELAVTLTGGDPALTAGDLLIVRFAGDGHWTRGPSAEWEAWDGTAWTRTHVLLDSRGDPFPESVPVEGSDEVVVEDVGFPVDEGATYLVPPEAEPGRHRVCVAFVADGGDSIRPCLQLDVHEPRGDPAVWAIAPEEAARARAGATTFTVQVSRLGCNSGVTGEVVGEGTHTGPDEVVLDVRVEHDADGGDCPSNAPVPYEVTLSEPLDGRPLVDGACRAAAARTSFCEDDGIRIGP
jgi:hypothetical protein